VRAITSATMRKPGYIRPRPVMKLNTLGTWSLASSGDGVWPCPGRSPRTGSFTKTARSDLPLRAT
jgi:hypothetical protein